VVDVGAALAFGADGATGAAGAFNAAWLFGHWVRGAARGRRLAAVTLALVNAGIAVQAAFAQALFTAHRFAWPEAGFFAPAPWLASRVVLLAGTLLLSLLILRRSSR
jgi:hypothetical protein